MKDLAPVVIALSLSYHAHAGQTHVDPWKIVSASDWHSAEGGVLSKDPSAFEKNQASEKRLIAGTVACKPDVVIIAGDMGSGRWTIGALKKAGAFREAESIKGAIHRLGEKTYRTMKANFAAAGVERLFVCIGDHGLGDNDWPPGGERARCVPYHREIFGLSYNADPTRRWLWPETVCGVSSRPAGTAYAGTSFAVHHKNVLFVQVDVFHQDGPTRKLHPRHGSIHPDLQGAHLAWFENVLSAGRQDEAVRYILVQAHTPALPPVRAQSSSMMMVQPYNQSNILAAMRRVNVDLYFAGEVHATTVTKDAVSDLVQVVTDRNMPTVITVHDDKLQLQCFDRSLAFDGRPKVNALYPEHRLTIDKTDGQTRFMGGKGVLKPLDTRAVFIHYPFDVLAPTLFGPRRHGEPTILNHGELNCTYDARTHGSRLVEGKLGRGLTFTKGGVVDIHGTGPFGFYDRVERTLAVWFKTSASGKYNLICGGNGIRGNKWGGAGFMDLVIEKGRLLVRTSAGETSTDGRRLNDGRWHHAALVVMPAAQTLADIRVYVDGDRCGWAVPAAAQCAVNATTGIYGLSLGGTHRPVWSGRSGESAFASFEGVIDDFAAWYRALSDEEMRQLYQLANTEKMNASDVDRSWRVVAPTRR